MKNNILSIVPILLILSLALGGTVLATNKNQESPLSPSIFLKAGTITPGIDTPSLPPGYFEQNMAANDPTFFLVQFTGPIDQNWKGQLINYGVELFAYIPDFAYKVRMTGTQAERVSQLTVVNWVGLFEPEYKLSPDLAGTPGLFALRLESNPNQAENLMAIRETGAQILQDAGNFLVVYANPQQIKGISKIQDVAWIENYRLKEKLNEYGGGQIIGASTANDLGYDGSTQIVAVADTGLGGGTTTTAHPDIPSSRISAIFNRPGSTDICFESIVDDGAKDVDSGHGTHTAASVVSDGGLSGEGKGTAPAGNLVFQAIENYVIISALCQALYGYPDGYYLTGIPADLNELYQQAYNAGARIHSNSWGSGVNGDYTIDSANSDTFIWNNKDMVVTFSAGNAGVDANSNGVVDNDSTNSPATAKNVITVGASENDRQGHWECDTSLGYTNCASQGGQNNLFTWGAAWPGDFPANPLKDDISAGNAEQMAAFSSRGPTDDGRIKPDVVAPGTWILSGYSDLYQQGYDPSTNPQNSAWQYDGWGYPLNNAYKYMGGTSMSNPLAAGGAAVIRDFYEKAHAINASSALVKATLINSARDMLDENNDGVNDNDFPIPNVHEGWGRIDLANATDGTADFVDNTAGLNTNGSTSFPFNVQTSGTQLRITLVWSDYPSTENASINLVNDLDLEVSAPSGTLYLGNVFSSGWSTTGGSADRRNNVENVYIQSATSGTWTVRVRGYNVPNGPQPFALVVDGVTSVPPPTSTPTQTPTATATASNTPIPPTATFTPTATSTASNTPIPPTATFTSTPTPTASNTPIPPTATFTSTATATASHTPTSTSTATYTPTTTATNTATATFTQTMTPTSTATFTPTPTETPVVTTVYLYVPVVYHNAADALSSHPLSRRR